MRLILTTGQSLYVGENEYSLDGIDPTRQKLSWVSKGRECPWDDTYDHGGKARLSDFPPAVGAECN